MTERDGFRRYDARGLRCPLPVVRAEAILRTMEAGDILEIIADDPVAIIDIPHFCRMAGHHADRKHNLEGEYRTGQHADEANVCVFRVTACGKSTE